MKEINPNSTFFEQKKRLNPAQLQAVETTEGPVLTIAGPGTGKTQVLAIRIGELLQSVVGLSPYNILCLTYTDAAAHNMRSRLLSFIGKDAYKVSISTYHAFCSQVIQQYPSYFGKLGDGELKPIDNLAYMELMGKFLKTMDNHSPLKQFSGDLITHWRSYKTLFSEIEKEQFSEEYLYECIDRFVADISKPTEDSIYFYKNGKDKKGTPKPKLQEKIDQQHRLKSAIAEKRRFDALLTENGYYTFDQMILFVIDAFRKYPDLLLDYQERFQYFLVDEYQDTNSAQNELLFLLCQYWEENPNLFVVGDDDQSIFRFQGASTENIFQFKAKYATHLKEILLTQNYRSAQQILDGAELFIQQNTGRLLPNKQLMASNTDVQSADQAVSIVRYGNVSAEEVGIVLRIQALIQQGVNPSEIAILYKKHSHSENLQRLLEEYHIPFELHSTPDVLKEVLISQLVDLLLYISKEAAYPGSRDDLLYHALHFEFFKLPSLLILAIYQKKENSRKGKSLRQIIASIQPKDYEEFNLEDVDRLKKISIELEQLFVALHNTNVQTFIQKVMYNLGMVAYAHASPQRIWLMEALYSFFSFVKEETQKEPFKPLAYFVERISLYKNQQEPIASSKLIKKEHSVKLMTVFASKGLEFEHVFVIKSTASNWEKARKPAVMFKLPENVFTHTTQLSDEQIQKTQELRRLFYVALTRAKKAVYISYADRVGTKLEEMSTFVAELIHTGKTNINDVGHIPVEEVDSHVHVDGLSALLKDEPPKEVHIELANKAWLRSRLDKFELSASSLKQYIECPLGFYYSSLLNIPRASSPDQGYGKSVHLALKKVYPDFRYKEKGLKSKEEFIGFFEKEMDRHRSYFTEETFEFYKKDRGRHFLSLFYDHYIDQLKAERVVQLEYPIHLVIEGVPVFGILDKLVFNGNEVTIYDYKTGKFSKSEKETKRLLPPASEEDMGGEYWRQGAFYQLLVDHISLKRPDKKWKTGKVIFQYVEMENDQFHAKEFVYEDAQMEHLKRIIVRTWESIQNMQFDKGCGKSTCAWCTFAQKHSFSEDLIASTMDSE